MTYNVVLLLQFVIVFLSLILIVIVGRERPSKEQKYLFTMAVGLFLNSVGYVMVLMSHTAEASEYGTIVRYMGNCVVVPFYMMFVLSYCRIRIPKWVPYLIGAVSIAVFICLFTNRFHHLYYLEYIYDNTGAYPEVTVVRGPLYLIYLVPLIFYNLTLDYVCITRAVREKNPDEKKRLYLFTVAAMISVILYLFHVSGLTGSYNPTAISYFIICLSVIVVIVRYRLFDMIQIAQEEVLETMGEGFIIFNTDETVMYHNPVAKRFFPEMVCGEKLEVLGSLSGLKDPENTMISREKYILRISVQPVYVRKIFKGYKGWIFDCTYSELQRKRLVELKEQAEQANMAKSRFLASMSHEIRTPMNAILGMTQLIMREQGLSEGAKGNISNIQHAGNSLLSIINDVLDYAKIESGKIEIVSAEYHSDRLLRDLDNQVSVKLAEKEVNFTMEVDSELPSVLIGDVTRLRQILTELLYNAVKYTDFGKIILRVGFEEIEPEENHPEEKVIMLRLEVSDTGIGIQENSMQNLFQPFQQASDDGHFTEGKGLGLSIVKRLLDLMEGEIQVKSVFGCGSTFTILLPQKVGDAAPTGEYVQGRASLEKPSKAYVEKFHAPEARILAVDDNAVNLKVLKGLLAPYKIQVDTAFSGLECLEILKQESYDLIFMDYMMPEMDGIETFHLIRSAEQGTGRQVPVIALTANAVNGAREMFLAEGFQEYISKPIDMKHMEKVLLEILPEELIQRAEDEDVGQYMEDEDAALRTDEVTEPPFSIRVEGIDFEKGLAFFGGDKEAYLLIAKSIVEEGSEMCLQMSQELLEEDFENYIIHAHALKGITANIGADSFSQQAKALEFAGKEKRYEYIREHHKEVLTSFGQLAEGIDRLVDSEAEKAAEYDMQDESEMQAEQFPEYEWSAGETEDNIPDGIPDEEVSDDELYSMLTGLKECLETFDIEDALKIIQECCRRCSYKEMQMNLKEIEELIQTFRYIDAASRVSDLMDVLQKQG